ncbi:hypothetical protein [Bdellovibrio reynosensis]|uniref:Uncharacterized protein n=1 Tax=Bdellovibrio reynosensis TaxID=2835041 RepID=A0ABY4CD89_9BACT|nr:hypothetical protein [Bdellovibrio reynosensis]UOF01636.1 hypothetical protein MNR06_01545 [Bdellovibrio reynosensis]
MPLSSVPANKFKRLSEELCAYIEDEGLSIRPYSSELLPYFHQLTDESKDEVVATLNDYLNICKSVYAEGRQLKDAEFFTLKALEYYKFEASPALFKILKNPKFITEFYSFKNTQFFRTLNFFEVTSYTIEDIYCRQWIHLYEREEKVAAHVYEVVTKMVEGKGEDNYFFTEKNILKERASLERVEMVINGLHISALKHQGQITALASCVDCEPIFNLPTEEED